jgi:hypothetical protein
VLLSQNTIINPYFRNILITCVAEYAYFLSVRNSFSFRKLAIWLYVIPFCLGMTARLCALV